MKDNVKITQFLDMEGRIKQFPVKQEPRTAVLRYLADKFEWERDYTEKEVNAVCEQWHTFGDYFLLRRSLIDKGLLARETDGSRYWRMSDEMRIPKTLKHKPVFAVENYASVDGRLAGDTDAKGLSLGLAQWNERGRVDISAKVWRYTGEKWSRQSEELPLHRVLDLVLLLISAKKQMQDAYRYPALYNPDEPVFERVPLQGDAMSVQVSTDNPYINDDIKLFTQAMAEDDELLSERLHRLSDMLRELGYGRRAKGGEQDG